MSGRGTCVLESKGIRYEFGLSRASVRVERSLYNAAPDDKGGYFRDSIRVLPAATLEPAEDIGGAAAA